MKISVFGMGYVGVVTSACLAKLGHSVTGIDIVKQKVNLINDGISPITEPGLSLLVQEMVGAGRFCATLDAIEGLKGGDAIMVCVGTPSYPNGEVNLSSIIKVTEEIADYLKEENNDPVVIFRSTIPPGTAKKIIEPIFREKVGQIKLVYHPEFLREGSAINDFFKSPEVVAASVSGISEEEIEAFFAELYKDINFVFQHVQPQTAEMIKYVNNTFHALKVCFANEIARICRSYEIDVHELIKIFLSDTKLNISTAYLKPGFAYGGSCLPKDLRALVTMARRSDIDIPAISSIERSNDVHIDLAFQLILNSRCKKIGFLGLSFKSGTDDVRESPFIKLAEKCIGKGLEVRIFDQMINLKTIMGKNLEYLTEHISHITERLVGTVDEATDFADFIVLCHSDRLYQEALAYKLHKKILDLTGTFKRKELGESKISIILSKKELSFDFPISDILSEVLRGRNPSPGLD